MFERIATGWQLTKQSWRVLMMDKELLLFPLASGLACIAVLASFALPLLVTGYGADLLKDGNVQQNPVAWVIAFAFYFVNYFVIVFFNSALVACAIIRFKGGNPTLSDGISAAMARLPQIIGWALVSASVGLLLKAIESYSEKFGQIVAALLGGAWSIATFFVVPVLVVEQVGPIDAVRRSLSVLRRTWGESAVGNLSIGMITSLFSLLGIIPIVAGFMAFGANQMALGILGISIGVVYLLILALVQTAMQAILRGALYLYAAEGKIPSQFDDQLFQQAFRDKKSRA